MTEIRTVTSQIIDRVRSYANEEHNQPAPFGPINGVEFISTPTAFISADKKITIRKIIGGRVLTENEVIALLHGETIGPFNDFRSKKGKPFTASIHLNNLKIEFIFAESQNELDVDLIKKGPSLGLSPLDQTAVYATPTAYMSLSALTGNDKKGLKIGKTILAKEITEENVKQLLQQGKTDLITGFISKKKKPFDAYLILEKNGTLRFEFPPRNNNRTKQIDSPEGKGHK